MQTVILEDFGTFLGRKGDRLVVRKNGKTLAEFPVSQIERVIVSSTGASVSSAALHLAVENRIPVSFTYSDGTPFGFLMPTEGYGTVLTRRAQYLEASTEKALHLAKGFVTGKLLNQQALLTQWARSRTRIDAESSDKLFELAERVRTSQTELEAIEGLIDTGTRDLIMNIEGRAANAYWEGVAAIVPDEFDFSNRNTRGAKDPFNMMLNYGYGILYSEVWSAVNTVGLDPFAGFLHVDRPGRPSLVLDLIEEFRQQAVDRVIVRLTTMQMIRAAETTENSELSKQARQVIAREVVGRLSEHVQVQDKKIELKNAIVRQAWAVARFLKGEASRYEPFSLRW